METIKNTLTNKDSLTSPTLKGSGFYGLSDKSAKLNKPPKAKVEGGGIGTLKPTKEEIAENKKVLKHAQKLAKNKKIIRLPQGFCYEYEKMKAEVNARKNKKFAD